MRALLLGSVAALAFSAGSAFAADLSVPADPYIPADSASSWSGFYAGANVGYGYSGFLHDGDSDDTSQLQGWVGGVQAGYNWDLGGVVLGVEADASFANINEGDDEDHFDADDGIHGLATLRGRAGVAVGSVLLYGTAGVAWAALDTEGVGQSLTGWVAGVGVESFVTDTISVKAEYLYHDFGSVYVEGYDGDFDITANTFKVGVNFHF